jgi:hypothetical protein
MNTKLPHPNGMLQLHAEVSPISTSLVVLSLAVSLGDGPQDIKAFQGKWKVTAAFEDGKSLSEKEIASQLFVLNSSYFFTSL